jgi:hypothetical protein
VITCQCSLTTRVSFLFFPYLLRIVLGAVCSDTGRRERLLSFVMFTHTSQTLCIHSPLLLFHLYTACRLHTANGTRRKVTFEYVMLAGVNDSDADADEMARLVAAVPCMINLIPFNAWPGTFQDGGGLSVVMFSFEYSNVCAFILRIHVSFFFALSSHCALSKLTHPPT